MMWRRFWRGDLVLCMCFGKELFVKWTGTQEASQDYERQVKSIGRVCGGGKKWFYVLNFGFG